VSLQEYIFKNIKLQIVENDLDLRSYRLNFNKMKSFFDLVPYTDILQESSKIIKNFEEKNYGDVDHKKYYNA
jgi:hypothetical protein